MAKFCSDWIERDTIYRELPNEGGIPHFREEPRRVIVCLCGSTRFADAFHDAQRTETLAGKIVLSVGMFGHAEGIDMNGPVKHKLDELHKDKIDLADEVLILNVGGYVGSSTRSEVLHAQKRGKTIRWLEPDKIPEDLQRTVDFQVKP